jgi:hypothetical protein
MSSMFPSRVRTRGRAFALFCFTGAAIEKALSSLCCLRKLRIWQLLRLNQFQERVTKKELITAVVKAMLQLIQIGVQMLHAQLVIRPHHAALKQTPDVLNGICVNIAANPLFLSCLVLCRNPRPPKWFLASSDHEALQMSRT